MVVFQCNKGFLILLCVMHQILSKILTQNCICGTTNSKLVLRLEPAMSGQANQVCSAT